MVGLLLVKMGSIKHIDSFLTVVLFNSSFSPWCDAYREDLKLLLFWVKERKLENNYSLQHIQAFLGIMTDIFVM